MLSKAGILKDQLILQQGNLIGICSIDLTMVPDAVENFKILLGIMQGNNSFSSVKNNETVSVLKFKIYSILQNIFGWMI